MAIYLYQIEIVKISISKDIIYNCEHSRSEY